MLIYSLKLQRKHYLAAALTLAILCGALAAYAGFQSLFGAESSTVFSFGGGSVRNNEARTQYLGELGWTTSEEAVLEEELDIPEPITDVDYVALQAEQGFTLTEYEGKRVERYTYAITNYPDGSSDIYASILIHRGEVIGGEVFSAQTGEVLGGIIPGPAGSTDTESGDDGTEAAPTTA